MKLFHVGSTRFIVDVRWIHELKVPLSQCHTTWQPDGSRLVEHLMLSCFIWQIQGNIKWRAVSQRVSCCVSTVPASFRSKQIIPSDAQILSKIQSCCLHETHGMLGVNCFCLHCFVQSVSSTRHWCGGNFQQWSIKGTQAEASVTLIKARIKMRSWCVLCVAFREEGLIWWIFSLQDSLLMLSDGQIKHLLRDTSFAWIPVRNDNTTSILQTQALHFNATQYKIFASLIGLVSGLNVYFVWRCVRQ